LAGCVLGATTRVFQFRDPLQQKVLAASDQFVDLGGDVVWSFG
jgi:hypothetical protein